MIVNKKNTFSYYKMGKISVRIIKTNFCQFVWIAKKAVGKFATEEFFKGQCEIEFDRNWQGSPVISNILPVR